MLLALALTVLTPSGWVPPEQAQTVRVLRTGTPFVAVAEVLSSERITACDVAIVEGRCPGDAPNRTDDWWLKSDVFAVPPPSAPSGDAAISWDAVTQCSLGAQTVPCEPKGYWVLLRPDPCAISATNCEPTAYGAGVFVTATRFEFRGLVGKHLTSVQAESSEGHRGALSDEISITPSPLSLVPGKVTGVRQE